MGLTGDGPRQERLTGPGWTEQQDTVRHSTAESLVALGRAEEVDNLGQLGLHLVDPGHIVEGHPDLLRIDSPCLGAAEVSEAAQPSRAGRRSPRQ